MKPRLIVTIAIIIAFLATSVIGQEAPDYLKNTYPKDALKSAIEARKALSKHSVLDAKTRALIALGVAAQIPCAYCVYAHNKIAIAAGASDDEIREAVAIAAQTRQWSTIFYGMTEVSNLD